MRKPLYLDDTAFVAHSIVDAQVLCNSFALRALSSAWRYVWANHLSLFRASTTP